MSKLSLIERLEKIEEAALGNERLQTLKEVDSPELRELLTYAWSPDITFGMKKLPDPIPSQVASLDDGEWWPEFVEILEAMAVRQLTGNDAKQRVGSFFGLLSPLELKWAERVLKQDLRLNIGAKDVNKTLGEVIPLFQVALAEPTTDKKGAWVIKPKELEGRWSVQPKFDGARCVAYLPGDKRKQVKLLSRTGKMWHNFESVRATLQDFNQKREDGGDIWLDGEVIAYVDGKINFQALQKNLHRKTPSEIGDLRYVVFDRQIGGWKAPTETYETRYRHMTDVVIPHLIRLTKAKNVNAIQAIWTSEVTEQYLRDMCKTFVDAGYEGAMARKATEPGKLKRAKSLLKVKTFIDSEAVIVDLVEGTGRLVGMLGALKCTMGNAAFEIGTGFDDKDRAELWDRSIIGQKVNFKYFELTNDGVPRFPVYRAIRHEHDIG